MVILLTILHVIICLFLVIVVLLQSGKAADLAGAFGGMGSQTAFGPRGASTVLSKATEIAAALFMVTSLSLGILSTRSAGGSSSVLERQKTTTQQKKAAPQAQPTVQMQQEGSAPGKAVPLPMPEKPATTPEKK